ARAVAAGLAEAAQLAARAHSARIGVAGLAVADVLREQVGGERGHAVVEADRAQDSGRDQVVGLGVAGAQPRVVDAVQEHAEVDRLIRRRVGGDDARVGHRVAVGVLAGLPAGGVARALRARGAGDALGPDRAIDGALGVAVGALAADAL